VPGWHKQTSQLVANGELAVAGIVQEQHPDRAALYMQWQKMDWPVLADPFNSLGISAVPITLLIDQHGIIRYKNPKSKDLKTWRRRIQQYGPRLDKPYSFYDWVATARRELIKNGEKPIHLTAEPSGAEFATPAKSSRSSKTDAKHQGTHSEHPDPENKVHQDTDQLITTSIVKVSSTNKRRAAIRVHLTLTPSVDTNWTNDAGNISCYLTPNSGAKIQDLKIPELPNTDNSSETRVIEFEVHPKNGKKLPESITTTVFYYVCTEERHRHFAKEIITKARTQRYPEPLIY